MIGILEFVLLRNRQGILQPFLHKSVFVLCLTQNLFYFLNFSFFFQWSVFGFLFRLMIMVMHLVTEKASFV